MMKTRIRIKQCVVAALVAAGMCAVYAQSAVRDLANVAEAYTDRSREKREQEAAPDHVKEIFVLARKSAEEDFNVNFSGFFVGMSRQDAIALAKYYKLKDGEYSVHALPEKAVHRLWFSLKGVRRITKNGNTLEELAQAVANRVGDLKWNHALNEWGHKTIDGVIVKMSKDGLSIQQESAELCVAGIIESMVAIPGKNFKMGKYEVTQKQWSAVMGTERPSKNKGDDNPVDDVSLSECREFVEKLNIMPVVKASGLRFRLPKEAEWEFACRAGGTGEYCRLVDGTEITEYTLGTVAWYKGNSDYTTHPVGMKKPNAFGLYDILGNAWEQCEDRDGIRGGSFNSYYGFCRWLWFEGEGLGGLRLAADTEEDRQKEKAIKEAARQKEAARKAQVAAEEAARKERAAREEILRLVRDVIAIPGKSFKIGKYEVTQAQWQAVMGENPSEFKNADNPVENVSWDDCKKFIEKLNALPEVKTSGLTFRLPTEAEWEYACRAGGTGDFCKLADGTEITKNSLGEVAWYDDNSGHETHPVGQKKPNAFGLYDMHGNVWEWCEDLHQTGNLNRVYRGGSWNYYSRNCKAGYRLNSSPDYRLNYLGFRLAASKD